MILPLFIKDKLQSLSIQEIQAFYLYLETMPSYKIHADLESMLENISIEKQAREIFDFYNFS